MLKEPRRTVKLGSVPTKRRCLRFKVCKGYLTSIAVAHGDPFCSRDCAVAHYQGGGDG